jgi:hypothetical protein
MMNGYDELSGDLPTVIHMFYLFKDWLVTSVTKGAWVAPKILDCRNLLTWPF